MAGFNYKNCKLFLGRDNSILAGRTSGTFGFAHHTSRPFAKPKEPNRQPHPLE